MTATVKAAAITEGTDIAVRLGVATAHCAIGVTSIYGTVSRTSEKAVEITTYETGRKVWFPRKALVTGTERDGFQFFALARWFKPSAQQFSAASHSSLAA